MAQINLLKQTGSNNSWEAGPKIFVRAFAVALAILVGYYLWLYIDLSQTGKKINETQVSLNADKQTALALAGRDELLTRQVQIKDLQGLIAAHPYWSQLFSELAKVTLKTASYSTLRTGAGSDLNLNVTVPTLADMDKYMQVFDRPEFNKNFSDLHISGFSKIQGKTSTAIQFSVRMKYNPAIIQYQAPAGTAN